MTAADQIVRSVKKVLAMEGRPHMTVVRRLVCPSEIEDEPIKWTFPSVVATIRPLSLLKTISHAKMAPDSHAAKMAPPKAILPSP